MRVRHEYRNVHELKGMGYQILSHLHDLEISGKKRSTVTGCMIARDPCLLELLRDYRAALVDAFTCFEDQDAVRLSEKYLVSLHNLFLVIENNLQGKRALRKKRISSFLRQHTQLFNALKERRTIVNKAKDPWRKTVLIAVAIWGDGI